MTVYENARTLEPGVRILHTPEEVAERLSPSGKAVLGPAAREKAYYNPSGGWVHASAAMTRVYAEIRSHGGELIPCAVLESVIRDKGRMVGVRCTDGREFYADKFIMALGSWTGGHPVLRDILPKGLLVPTGQTVSAVQLSEEEMERYRDIPTVSNLDGSGYYSFPVSDRCA